jgi:hypothetical protein
MVYDADLNNVRLRLHNILVISVSVFLVSSACNYTQNALPSSASNNVQEVGWGPVGRVSKHDADVCKPDVVRKRASRLELGDFAQHHC